MSWKTLKWRFGFQADLRKLLALCPEKSTSLDFKHKNNNAPALQIIACYLYTITRSFYARGYVFIFWVWWCTTVLVAMCIGDILNLASFWSAYAYPIALSRDKTPHWPLVLRASSSRFAENLLCLSLPCQVQLANLQVELVWNLIFFIPLYA